MATTEQDSGKTYADMWGEAVHSNRHLRVLSMGLAGLVLLLVVIIIRLSSVELPKPIGRPRGRGRPRRGAGL